MITTELPTVAAAALRSRTVADRRQKEDVGHRRCPSFSESTKDYRECPRQTCRHRWRPVVCRTTIITVIARDGRPSVRCRKAHEEASPKGEYSVRTSGYVPLDFTT